MVKMIIINLCSVLLCLFFTCGCIIPVGFSFEDRCIGAKYTATGDVDAIIVRHAHIVKKHMPYSPDGPYTFDETQSVEYQDRHETISKTLLRCVDVKESVWFAALPIESDVWLFVSDSFKPEYSLSIATYQVTGFVGRVDIPIGSDLLTLREKLPDAYSLARSSGNPLFSYLGIYALDNNHKLIFRVLRNDELIHMIYDERDGSVKEISQSEYDNLAKQGLALVDYGLECDKITKELAAKEE